MLQVFITALTFIIDLKPENTQWRLFLIDR